MKLFCWVPIKKVNYFWKTMSIWKALTWVTCSYYLLSIKCRKNLMLLYQDLSSNLLARNLESAKGSLFIYNCLFICFHDLIQRDTFRWKCQAYWYIGVKISFGMITEWGPIDSSAQGLKFLLVKLKNSFKDENWTQI